MFVCNDEVYGYVMVPLEKGDQLSYDLLQLRNLKLEVLGIYFFLGLSRCEHCSVYYVNVVDSHIFLTVEGGPLVASETLVEYVQEPVDPQINVEKIFMINLERRPDRRKRMELSFAELHLDVSTIKAVDGQ